MPITGTKTSSVPATTPGSDRGSVTFKNVRSEFAPRSAAASYNDGSIFSSEVYMGRIMNGMNS